MRDRARELFNLDQPVEGEHGDHRRVATIWSLSLERVHQEAPAAETLLNLCAFLAPDDIPRELPGEHPEVLPEQLAAAVHDPLAYNQLLAVVGRYSLATVTPTSLGVHRLVQAVLRARLDEEGEPRWAETAVRLLRKSFPEKCWEVETWPTCQRLIPHLLAAAGHGERVGVAGEAVGWLLNRASIYLRERAQYRQAEPIAKRALAVTEATLGPDDPEVGERHDECGRVLGALGESDDAKAHFERALAIDEAALGPDHPTVANRRNGLGEVLLVIGDLAGAKAQFERAIQIDEAAPGFGPDHQDVAVGRNNLGRVLQALGDLESAKAQFERALEISEAWFGPKHKTVAIWHFNLGRLLKDAGDLEHARAEFEQSLVIDEATLGPDHPTVAIRRGSLGLLLRDLGDLEGARAQLERALEVGEAPLGTDHPEVAAWRGSLGGVLQALQEATPEGPASAV